MLGELGGADVFVERWCIMNIIRWLDGVSGVERRS